jgi:hypothetical protein
MRQAFGRKHMLKNRIAMVFCSTALSVMLSSWASAQEKVELTFRQFDPPPKSKASSPQWMHGIKVTHRFR